MIDPATARVLDWLRRHTGPNSPALFSISREDAQRLLALVDGSAPDELNKPERYERRVRWGYDPSGERWGK